MNVLAHGIGGVRDLPVPTWLFYWGGGVVLVASFVALGVLWNRPALERHLRGRPTPIGPAVLRPVRIAVQALSVLLFALVFGAALVGDTDPLDNLAPTWVYVVFWLGVPLLSVLLGDVWRVLSPWRALADAWVWATERSGREARRLADYPEGLGRWPAAVALCAFVALELTYSDPDSPRSLAFAIAIYSYVTLLGMAAFGRDTWTERGEGFAVLFGFFARMAPLAVDGGRVRLRRPFTGLAGAEPMRGTVAFVAITLGSVAFDGFSRTTTWQDWTIEAQDDYVVDNPGLAELIQTGMGLGAILAFALIVAAAYRAACFAAERATGARASLVPDFLLSLVPIAFVYEVAHYFSLFVLNGQYAIPLLSDPLGRGWDLLGTADVVPDLGVLTPNATWYVQASALVIGHVVGLAVAHDRALVLFREHGVVVRSQIAMLALMVLYTVGGLWLLSRG
ncbi:MAG: fenitrothion hydrolase [Actinobacteria bacterium]|nr:fenitrothion hydrolase [Actinomycetota bacterium]